MNKRQILASLNKIANELDGSGLYNEANSLTKVMIKISNFITSQNNTSEVNEARSLAFYLYRIMKVHERENPVDFQVNLRNWELAMNMIQINYTPDIYNVADTVKEWMEKVREIVDEFLNKHTTDFQGSDTEYAQTRGNLIDQIVQEMYKIGKNQREFFGDIDSYLEQTNQPNPYDDGINSTSDDDPLNDENYRRDRDYYRGIHRNYGGDENNYLDENLEDRRPIF